MEDRSPPGATATQPPLQLGQGATADFFTGLRYLARGATFIQAHRPLWPLVLAPALISLVLLSGLIVAMVAWADDLTGLIWAYPSAWYLAALWWLLAALIGVVVLFVGAVSLPGLVAAPFLEAISQGCERIQAGAVPEGQAGVFGLARELGRSVAHELVKLGVLFAGHLLLFPLGFIPALGVVAYPVLAALWTMLWTASDKLHAPMSRARYPLGALSQLVGAQRALVLGFGAGTFALLFVPFLNLLLEPVAAVGGTLLYLDLRQAGALPPPPEA